MKPQIKKARLAISAAEVWDLPLAQVKLGEALSARDPRSSITSAQKYVWSAQGALKEAAQHLRAAKRELKAKR